MTLGIAPIPDVPDTLREAAQLSKLVPFVGAGASKLAGCPGWDEFADGALRLFVDHGKFSHAQLDQIKHLRPRIKLSIEALDFMEDELRRCVDANFEFSTLAGAYIGNLEYIDHNWLEQNIVICC